jgi:hypothetical protein
MDVQFSAVQARHNGDFECVTCDKWGVTYVKLVESSAQGKTKGGGAILPARTDPYNATGFPDWTPGGSTGFFSLGVGGSITLAFINPVKNGPGDDLSFHEATNGRDSYPLESAKVEVSFDNVTYYLLGNVTSEPGEDGISYLDFDSTGLDYVKYVRLTDNTDFSPHNNDADGYDLDTIDGVYGKCIDKTAG